MTPLFDAHCDTLSAMQQTGQPLWKNNLHVDLFRGQAYVPRAQFFAIFGRIGSPPEERDTGPWFETGADCFDSQYAIFQNALEESGAHMALCRTAADAEAAHRAGKTAAFLSVEGAEILDCSLGRLERAHGQGVRMVTLTWNDENRLSGSNAEGESHGLTDAGRRFVRRCGELGVIVDVSHLSEPGFWDVLEEAEGPVIASHSNAAALWPHARNLTDRQFQALARRGGVAGINLYAAFIGRDPDVDDVVAHIEHFLALGGEGSVAMGGDLDGCDRLPRGIAGVEDVEKIAQRLLQKNYTDGLVCDIFYNNLMRVVREVCVI